MAIDVGAIISDITAAGTGAGIVALAWVGAGWWMKAVHLVTRSHSEREYDACRDWDDPSTTKGRWYD